MEIKIKDQTFILLPEKAIFWKDKATLLIADLHIGKASHFRKAGFALPANIEYTNYDTLATLILNNPVERVIFLGDLFHSSFNEQWTIFNGLLNHFPKVIFDLVLGNHDILSQKKYDLSRLNIYDTLEMPPFIMSHYPIEHASLYNLCGHIHPAVKLRGSGRQKLTLPCFFFSPIQGILPSFGVFTGSAIVKPKKEDLVFVIAQNSVHKVK